MLSIETRERLVRGYERTHNAKMIAQAYGVSEREVYKLAAQMRETGSVEPRTGNCGRKPKLSEEDLKRVDKAIQAQPDITFGELIRNLELDISESRLGRIVREKLGYSLKKKVIHASEQERPRCTGKASGMERTHGPGVKFCVSEIRQSQEEVRWKVHRRRAESLGHRWSRRAGRYAHRGCECRPVCRDILPPGISQRHGQRT